MSTVRFEKRCSTCQHWSEPAHKTVVYDPKEPWGRCSSGGAAFTAFPTPGRHKCDSWTLRKVPLGVQR